MYVFNADSLAMSAGQAPIEVELEVIGFLARIQPPAAPPPRTSSAKLEVH